MTTTLEELTALKSLLDQGALTQEEFDAKKAEILSQISTGPTPSSAGASATTVPADSKSKIAAGLLAIFLGSLGIHKFYLGYTQAGIIMLLVSLLGSIVIIGPAVMGVIALIEGIIYLTKTDEQFYLTYVVGQKAWF